MGEFPVSGSNEMSQANWDKMLKDNKQSHEGADYDSGWIATPSNKIVRHNLGVIPSEIHVFSSANSQGNPFAQDTFTSCDRTNITITGPSAYCRVRIQKGSI